MQGSWRSRREQEELEPKWVRNALSLSLSLSLSAQSGHEVLDFLWLSNYRLSLSPLAVCLSSLAVLILSGCLITVSKPQKRSFDLNVILA